MLNDNTEGSSMEPVNNQSGLVALIAGNPVTTTLAIAEGVGLEHASVISLVRAYLADFSDSNQVDFKSTWIPRPQGGGRETEYAVLDEQQATLLLTYMKNSDVVRTFKKRLVKAFFELRSNALDPIKALNDPDTLRGLLANYSERVLALQQDVAAKEAVIETQTPKVAALDRLSGAEGALCLRDAAKVLKAKERWLIGWLSHSRWIYKRPGKGNWLAYASVGPSGSHFMDHRTHVVTDQATGDRLEHAQVLITAKGLAHIAKHLELELSKPGNTVADLPHDDSNEGGAL